MNLQAFVKRRAPLFAIAAGMGFGVRCAAERPPAQSLDGLADMLGRASHTVVDPRDIRWEPSPGFFTETFLGRRLLFLGSEEKGKPRDVYRASVRVTLDGKPISVRQIRNITETPLGDDAGLEVRGSEAAFATVAFGSIQGVTLLELSGVRREDRPKSLFQRMLHSITAWQETGSLSGVGRTDVVLELPAKQAKLVLDPPMLRVQIGERGRSLVLDTRTRKLTAAEGGQAYAARAEIHRQHEKPLVLWGVDTVRAEVGPGPIAWLEDKVFGAKDTVRRTTFKLFSDSGDSNRLKDEGGADAVARVLDASKLADGDTWPPPPIPSLWKELKPGEGEWQPVELPYLRPLPTEQKTDKPPPYFYRTFIRPDKDRPYSEVMLIAMDMRQLELGMQAGFEDPKPLTGPPGDGRLPRNKDIQDRIVATFNGAFKTTHGKYGMMVDKRVLLPPVPGAATVMVTDHEDVGLGSWPQTEDIPDDIVSFRQNLDPLVEDGVANPTGRYIWGWQLTGTSVMTQRTALCVTPAGHLYYAFGPEIDGPTLGKALRQAGCSYGMHLDMNPGHCGFVFTDIVDMRAKEFHLKKAHDEMKLDPAKFVRWSAKDFFYVMVRNPVPQDTSRVQWKPDGGTQPAPSWLPGVFHATLRMGNLDVELTSFEPGRVEWRVRAGNKEPSMEGGVDKKLELSGDEQHKVVAAINMGHTTEVTRYGLAFDGKPALDLRSAYATVVVAPHRAPKVLPPGTQPQLESDEEAAQLPLLAEDGKLTDYALTHGPMRLRGALCVSSTGRVLIAQARHDSSDSLAAALMRTGCKRVVELDRGSQHPAFVHRAGTPTPPSPATTPRCSTRWAIPWCPTRTVGRRRAPCPAPSPRATTYRTPRRRRAKSPRPTDSSFYILMLARREPRRDQYPVGLPALADGREASERKHCAVQ